MEVLLCQSIPVLLDEVFEAFIELLANEWSTTNPHALDLRQFFKFLHEEILIPSCLLGLLLGNPSVKLEVVKIVALTEVV